MEKNSAAAREEYRAARAALDELAEAERRAGVKDETNEHLVANQRVIDAEVFVSWWLRF